MRDLRHGGTGVRRACAFQAEDRGVDQDDPSFPRVVKGLDDTALEQSFRFEVEAVPTVIRLENGKEVARTFGWNRAEWERVTGLQNLGAGLPAMRPGCGSKTREPGVWEELVARYGDSGLASRRIVIGEWDDEIEACFDRGWSDGLPVVPPTDARIMRMLEGTSRKPEEAIGLVPPNLAPITVEKVAINAVLAGCKPEYMPVVLAALEAALEPEATMHGLLCTTCFSGPIIVVNGPITREIGMNSGINCLGQGNRANATIGRALQLIIRNVGGGRPGELDRAVLGGPGKYTFCFAEDESDPTWMPLSVARGSRTRQERGHPVPRRRHPGLHRPTFADTRAADEIACPVAAGSRQLEALRIHQRHAGAGAGALRHLSRCRLEPRSHHDELHAAMVRPGKDVVQGAHGRRRGHRRERGRTKWSTSSGPRDC